VKYCVIVSPEAENDLKEIFSWYEDNRIGLGYDFLLQVDAGINFVKRNPEIHPIKRFPYKIIYLVKEEEIIVLAVLHGKRSFELLKSRVENA